MIICKHANHFFSIRIFGNLNPLMLKNQGLSTKFLLIAIPSKYIDWYFIMNISFIKSQENVFDWTFFSELYQYFPCSAFFQNDKFIIRYNFLSKYFITSFTGITTLFDELNLVIIVFTVIFRLKHQIRSRVFFLKDFVMLVFEFSNIFD